MLDRCQNIDVDAARAQLRKLLADTRGLGRREFIKALGHASAGPCLQQNLVCVLEASGDG